MMRAYLRCRLFKIEKYAMFILDNEEEQEKLSAPELNHAQVSFHSSDARIFIFDTECLLAIPHQPF